MSSSVKTFVFAFVMCLVCGGALSFTAIKLRPLQEENVVLDKQKNILLALGVLDKKIKYTKENIQRSYKDSVKEVFIDDQGQLYNENNPEGSYSRLFLNMKNNRLESYAFHYSAYGLWSYIKGYFALRADGKTVQGITVYAHGETPGLGGECEKPWFQDQFKGKKIINQIGSFTGIGVVKGKVKDFYSGIEAENYVDGMSGATITSVGIQNDLNKIILAYEPFSKKLRGVSP